MAFDPETIGTGGVTGGVIAAVIHFFNREKINDLKKDFDDHKKIAVTVTNCVPCQRRSDEVTASLRHEMAGIKDDIKAEMAEIKGDIKELLRHSLQRRVGDI